MILTARLRSMQSTDFAGTLQSGSITCLWRECAGSAGRTRFSNSTPVSPVISTRLLCRSNAPQTSRRAALAAIRSRKSRIIVCVDMLGEGFDLPSLKIAAIHDPHKSLGVTLQFIGRFARTTDISIGDATVVVGRPAGEYDGTLRKLYAEDADWNLLIRDISETAVGYQQQISDFETGFTELPEEITLRSLLPKMSTVVYRSQSSDWKPEAILEVYPEECLVTVPIGLNLRDGVAWFVTEERTEVPWGDVKTLERD